MLLRFKIRNFLSFFEEVEFNMFPNLKRKHFSNHIYDYKIPLLKMASIHGANAAGKSNFIKALIFLRSFVLDGKFLQTINLQDYFFKLVKDVQDTISFEIEFLSNENYYIYSLELAENKIKETLFLSGLGEKDDEILFERNGDTIDEKYLQNHVPVKFLLLKNKRTSILLLQQNYPIFKRNIRQHIKSINEWFSRQLEIVTLEAQIPLLLTVMKQNPDLLLFTNELLSSVKISDTLTILETPLDKWAKEKGAQLAQKIFDQSSIQNNGNLISVNNKIVEFDIVKEGDIALVREFLFTHKGIDGYSQQMKIVSQSDGTIRLLMLIPAIYEAMKEGKTVVIDEIENSIHPNLMFDVIRFFSRQKTNGQLIFTTHLTKLLNQQELISPDEAWICDRTRGFTQMYSFNDYKIHNTISMENGYIEGRYGGIPDELSIVIE